MTNKTKYEQFEGELYWARVFEENYDDSEYHEHTQGQFNLVFVPKDYDELQRMYEWGFPEVSMNYTMVNPVEAADGRLGMKLKRPRVHPKVSDFGGAPVVVDWRNGIDNATEWSLEDDGYIGNGSKGFVRISHYQHPKGQVTIRLEGVAVTELQTYEPEDNDEDKPRIKAKGWV